MASPERIVVLERSGDSPALTSTDVQGRFMECLPWGAFL